MSEPKIKAIPTRWRGRFYRSRLEARWAVFFDTMGLKFEYEPEGYELPDGTRYLPDFYLYEVGWFAEIKPFSGTPSKAYKFVKHTGFPLLLLDGTPDFRSYTGFQPLEGDDPVHYQFSLDISTFKSAFTEKRLFSDPDYTAMDLGPEDIAFAFSITYRAAVEAALSARFDR